MYCDQCPEVLSGKGCTKNGPCQKQESSRMSLKNRRSEIILRLTWLKGIMSIFKKELKYE
ncbi:hypothetical protein [Methanosarcina sp.]|uniref:hypothetical protein n=1 Tax=Methanosarcina sp. TaxID=2213 RepID=UPI002AB7FE91|nr:hypothetical protein [Methanosarcina sp.]MDY9925394.1 hypothetical protein [Methanosarcina sp.]